MEEQSICPYEMVGVGRSWTKFSISVKLSTSYVRTNTSPGEGLIISCITIGLEASEQDLTLAVIQELTESDCQRHAHICVSASIP
jgi:hypothetical protein